MYKKSTRCKRRLAHGAVLTGALLVFMGLVVLTAAPPALAAKWEDTPSGLDLVITSVFVDFIDEVIAINSKNFLNGGNPIVILGDFDPPLEVSFPFSDDLTSGRSVPPLAAGTHTYKRVTLHNVMPNQQVTVNVDCDPGDRVVDGGYEITYGGEGVRILVNSPLDTDTWQVVFKDVHGVAQSLVKVWADCIDVQQ